MDTSLKPTMLIIINVFLQQVNSFSPSLILQTNLNQLCPLMVKSGILIFQIFFQTEAMLMTTFEIGHNFKKISTLVRLRRLLHTDLIIHKRLRMTREGKMSNCLSEVQVVTMATCKLDPCAAFYSYSLNYYLLNSVFFQVSSNIQNIRFKNTIPPYLLQ